MSWRNQQPYDARDPQRVGTVWTTSMPAPSKGLAVCQVVDRRRPGGICGAVIEIEWERLRDVWDARETRCVEHRAEGAPNMPVDSSSPAAVGF